MTIPQITARLEAIAQELRRVRSCRSCGVSGGIASGVEQLQLDIEISELRRVEAEAR